MMKFFRKHNRKLLAIFMALLLIVWLGGSALTSMISPSTDDRVIATSKLGNIEELDQRVANFETEMLEGLGINWKRPWAFNRAVQHEPLGLMEWILLTREAGEWGMMPRQVEVDSFLGNFGMTPDDIHRFAARRDVKAESIYAAIAKYIGIFRTLSLTVASATKSEAALRVTALNELEKVKVNLVSIDAKSFIDPDEEFSEEEIQSQFDKYRSEQAGTGIQFGYFQSPKIKVQYFKIAIEKVAQNLRIREKTLDARAKEYWRENKTHPVFLRPNEPEEDNVGESVGESADAEQPDDERIGPPAKPRSTHFETFDEARETATLLVRLALAKPEIEKMAAWLLQELSEPWFALAEGDDGFKAGTEELLAEGYYASVLERLPAGLRYGDAVSVEMTDFFKQADAFQVPGIGPSRTETAPAQRVFTKDAFHVQRVEPLPTASRADTTAYLATGQSSSVAYRNAVGDTFVYRVMDVIPSGPAEDLDDVRDQVIDDLRLLSAYEKAKESADRLVASVTFDGLQAAWNAEEELKGLADPAPGYYSPPPFGRRRPGTYGRPAFSSKTYLTGLGAIDESLLGQFFALEEQPEEMRVQPIYLDERAIVAVVEWVERLPLRVDEYEKERSRIARQMNDGVIAQAVSQWLDPVRIHDRTGFQVAGP